MGWTAEDGGLAETPGPEEGPGVCRGEAGRWRVRPVHREYEEDAAARRATALGTEADLERIVEEGKVVRAQPVVAKNGVRVRVATHVELHKACFIIKVAKDQLGSYRDQAPRARWVVTSRRPAARMRDGPPATQDWELGCQGPTNEAVRRNRVEKALDAPPTGRGEPGEEPAVHPLQGVAGGGRDCAPPGEMGFEGLQLSLQAALRIRVGWTRRQ